MLQVQIIRGRYNSRWLKTNRPYEYSYPTQKNEKILYSRSVYIRRKYWLVQGRIVVIIRKYSRVVFSA